MRRTARYKGRLACRASVTGTNELAGRKVRSEFAYKKKSIMLSLRLSGFGQERAEIRAGSCLSNGGKRD